jgi:hypothetical protein
MSTPNDYEGLQPKTVESLSDLRKYSYSNSCIKCGAQGAPVLWHSEIEGRGLFGHRSQCSVIMDGFIASNGVIPEHMHRFCECCSHEWAELPQDSDHFRDDDVP